MQLTQSHLFKYVGLFLLCSGFVCIGLALLFWFRTSAFVRGATTTNGRIVRFIERKDDHGITFAPVFSFADDSGKERTVYSSSSSYPPEYSVGDSVEIVYSKSNPADARIKSFFSLWGVEAILGGIGVSYLPVGITFLVLHKRAQRINRVPPVIVA